MTETNRVIIRIVFSIIVLSIMLFSCSQQNEFSTATIAVTHTSTPTVILDPTVTPTVTPTPIHPENKIVFHDQNDENSYAWFSFVPSGISKESQVYILITAIHGFMGTYDESIEVTENMLRERLGWPNINNFILIAPVIPRITDSQGDIYPIAFDLRSFSTTNEFVSRADLKINVILDEFAYVLEDDGYNVSRKVLIEGYSAGGMFAQRYTLLHPERVLGIAAGQCGGNFTLPLITYNGTILNWPVGINDLHDLSNIEPNADSYKDVHQFIYIGDQDSQVPNTILFPNEWGRTSMWQSIYQRDYLRETFGSNDPTRMENQIKYLSSAGFPNIEFQSYPGVKHQETYEMIVDKMNYLHQLIDPSYSPEIVATPSLPYTIDGYPDDWQISPIIKDNTGDSVKSDIDITAVYLVEDQNYLDLMITTDDPITKERATFDIGLLVNDSNRNSIIYELNINSHGLSYGGIYPSNWFSAPEILVGWADVVEVQIPKSLFEELEFSDIKFVSLFTHVDGEWVSVDFAE